MTTIIRKNERSWAIDLISEINRIVQKNDLIIKRASGENTISVDKRNIMFPDVILYGNNEQSIILQGWELKMPDVPIEDETFIKDAQRKAIALNLNSCLIWNFTYAVLYIRKDDNSFEKIKQWNATSHIRKREDVKIYLNDWKQQLEEIIIELNKYFTSGQLYNVTLEQVVSESIITTLIHRNKELIAEHLKLSAFKDSKMAAYIDNWWYSVKTEYEQDEFDKYRAYAKTIILNWTNRIIFAHIIKCKQNSAMLVDEIDYDKTPNEANIIFKKITDRCDFYNVFTAVKYNEILPKLSWLDFIEFSIFFRNKKINHLDQKILQNILEYSVATSKKAINGQYTTPSELARILLRLTVSDWSGDILDCCCGTGTIPKEAIKIKRTQMSIKEAIETVWACDKNTYPLQVANISMMDSDTINIANRLFQHNALTLNIGEKISITNPETGKIMNLSLPSFGAIVSNLPFVAFEFIPNDDKCEIAQISCSKFLDGRSDLYYYIAIKISDIIKPGGMLGIITSNSWLGTKAGLKFIDVLKQKYNICQVHISSNGRWFKNADIVATIMVLQKKYNNKQSVTNFCLWKKSLEELEKNADMENILINSVLLSTEINKEVVSLSKYTPNQIDDILNLNVSYNALFHNIDWLLDIKEKIIPINEVYHIFRGCRRGWDALFYPKNGEHRIESQYLRKVLINAKNVTKLIAKADGDAFCCSLSLKELEKQKHYGALEWIKKFSDQKNKVGKPLPIVLKKTNMEWYELKDNEIAEVFTMMNPDQRFFFARFETPSFVNQRLIGLNHKPTYPDEELNHALINSIFTMFYIEAVGFGRGLGVLDISKNSISNCYMLNPKLVSKDDRIRIIESFNDLKSRKIMKVTDELKDDIRLKFEYVVLKSFNIDKYFNKIKSSLLSMQKTRAAVKNKYI